MSQLVETYFDFNLYFVLIALIDACARKNNLLKYNLAVKINLVDEAYYLKQVFHLLCDTVDRVLKRI